MFIKFKLYFYHFYYKKLKFETVNTTGGDGDRQ